MSIGTVFLILFLLSYGLTVFGIGIPGKITGALAIGAGIFLAIGR